MINNRKQGFTLIELLVVVLIIGILAAMAMPQYFKAVERSRMSEAITLLGNIAQSQQRKYMQINKYTTNFNGLDVAPKGASGATYCTKGTAGATATVPATPTTSNSLCGTAGNGFLIELTGTTLNAGYAQASRTSPNTLQYAYTLKRYYGGTGTSCTAANDDDSKALCADFCGIDTYTAACCSDGGAADAGSCAQPS